MAKSLKAGKQAVKLVADGVRVSRIRRDPPPVAKKIVVADRDEVDRRTVAIGILSFTLAMLVIIAGVASYNGWSPSNYVFHM